MEHENNHQSILIRPYPSPCGELLLGSYCDKLCLCDWQVEGRRERIDNRLRRLLRAGMKEGMSEVIEDAARQLDEYFAGQRREFCVPLLFVGTDFQRAVWHGLLRIPYGQTATYGELAHGLGMPNAVRAVAGAVGANALSIFAPCHRVVGSGHALTGYAGGLEAKRWLLRIERNIH